jgi:predicted nucleotide-binding protein
MWLALPVAFGRDEAENRATVARTTAAEESANRRIAQEAKKKIAAFLSGLMAVVESKSRDERRKPVSSPKPELTLAKDHRKVFVVYGRNLAARSAMFAYLRSIGLHPLEWEEIVKETGTAAPYIGEVLTKGFQIAQAAVVLLTPDDEARLIPSLQSEHDPSFERNLTRQPRQNVLLEAGMALGLDEKRTVVVELGSMRPISDILGRHVVRIDNTADKRNILAQRLLTAGCAVNVVGTDWLSAGDFDAAVPTGAPVNPDRDMAPAPMAYFDGLSSDELFRIVDALKKNTQTIQVGHSDPTIASLEYKKFLEKVPFAPLHKLVERPYIFPNEIWGHLLQVKEVVLQKARAANATRADRIECLAD